jgi:hypothetical protein
LDGRRPSLQALKSEARRALLDFDLATWAQRARCEPRTQRVLQSLLFDDDNCLAWRAVEASGHLAQAIAGESLEPVRELLRRTLWLMNDESGGILWRGPELMGSVLAHVPQLAPQFFPILTGFLEESPFHAGTRWALWRLVTVVPGEVAALAPQLVASLSDPDARVRGHAALAIRAASASPPAPLALLDHDLSELEVFDYRSGTLCRTSVAQIARGQWG